MEWSELLPEDRRTMMALMNLDAQGLPLVPPGAAANVKPSSSLATDAAVVAGNDDDASTPHVPTVEPPLPSPATTATRVTQSQLKHGIASQVGLVCKHWKAVRDLSRRYNHHVPKMDHCAVSVRSILEGVCFTDFLVVLADVVCTMSVRAVQQQAPRRRARADSDAATDGQSGASRDCGTLPLCPAVEAQRVQHVLSFQTLHFVHRFKEDVGYEVQSVWVPGQPLQLQCVANNIVQFALLMFMRAQYGAPPGPGEAWDVARLSPPRRGDVVILGMGGNVMANCLVRLLPEAVKIRVVEIEPSVVAMCTMEGLLPDAPNFACHIADVAHALEQLDDASCALIVLDCFDPLTEDMMHCRELLRLSRRKLCTAVSQSANGAAEVSAPCGEEGVLIVNVHQRPTLANLQMFIDVFGPSLCVEAIDVFGARQCVVACTRVPLSPPTADRFNALAATVNANSTSVWSEKPRTDSADVPLFRLVQDFVRAGRGVVPKESNQEGSRVAFRVWDAANDSRLRRGDPTPIAT